MNTMQAKRKCNKLQENAGKIAREEKQTNCEKNEAQFKERRRKESRRQGGKRMKTKNLQRATKRKNHED